MPTIRELVAAIRQRDGVEAAIVLGRDGLLIDGQAVPKIRVAGHIPGRRTPVGFGDGWVLLVDFSKPGAAYSVLAYGQTTNQDSPHSSDQMPIFARHQLRPAWFTEADINANLLREYRP